MRFDGKRLAALRTAKKMGQHELAQAARSYGSGVTQAGVSKHENGKQPSARNAMAYALALGVQPTELYTLDDDEEEAAMAPIVREAEILEALSPLVRLLEKATR